MGKNQTITPDAVLAPETTDVTVQDDMASRVVTLHTLASQCASMAVYCAAAAGAVMLCKKKTLKHGQFLPWVSNIRLANGSPLGDRTAQRYMQLADEMVARIKALPNTTRVSYLGEGAASCLETLAAFEPTKLDDLRNHAVAELVSKATNEKGLRQLYFDWGIMKEPGKLGGKYHPRKQYTDEEIEAKDMELLRERWARLVQSLHFEAEDGDWMKLAVSEVEAIIAELDDVSKRMKKFQRERKS
jgi:hypothetical protein